MKKKINISKRIKNQTIKKELELFNTEQYIDDGLIIDRLKAPENTKDWIRNRRFELQNSANNYEQRLFVFLKENGFDFYHQMPFYIHKNVYFADFYLPKFNCIIEVDGISHNGREGEDAERDEDFKDAGIKTIRIKNEELTPEKLKFRFKSERLFRERFHTTPVFVPAKHSNTIPESASTTFTLSSKALKGKQLIASNIILNIIDKLSNVEEGSRIMVSTDNYTVFDLCYSKHPKNNEWPSVRLFKELVLEKKLIIGMDYRGEAINNRRCMELLSKRITRTRSFTYDYTFTV